MGREGALVPGYARLFCAKGEIESHSSPDNALTSGQLGVTGLKTITMNVEEFW